MYIDRKRVFDDVYEAFAMLAGGAHVSVYDAQTQVTHWCPDAVDVFALPGEYFDQGAYNWENSIHPDDIHLYRDCMLNLTIGKVGSYDLTYRVRIYDGSYILCQNKGMVIRGENGRPDFIGGVILNDEVLGRRCPLTGLRNINGFMDDIGAFVADKSEENILILGIKDFGDINNSYGYSYGNRFLREFTGMLKGKVSEDMQLYRLDDVKFAVISHAGSVEPLMDIFKETDAELGDHFVVDGILHKVSVSGNILTLDGTCDNAYEVKERLLVLLREAKLG